MPRKPVRRSLGARGRGRVAGGGEGDRGGERSRRGEARGRATPSGGAAAWVTDAPGGVVGAAHGGRSRCAGGRRWRCGRGRRARREGRSGAGEWHGRGARRERRRGAGEWHGLGARRVRDSARRSGPRRARCGLVTPGALRCTSFRALRYTSFRVPSFVASAVGARARLRARRPLACALCATLCVLPRPGFGVPPRLSFPVPLFVAPRVRLCLSGAALRLSVSRALFAAPGAPLATVIRALFVVPRALPRGTHALLPVSFRALLIGGLLRMRLCALRCPLHRALPRLRLCALRFVAPGALLGVSFRTLLLATPRISSGGWPGRGGGCAQQDRRTAAESDGHGQAPACPAPISPIEHHVPARSPVRRRVQGRSRTLRPSPQTRRSSARRSAGRRSPGADRRRASA
jgi:hypothetical protein